MGRLHRKIGRGSDGGLRPRRQWREASPLPHTMPFAPPGIRAAESCDGTDFQREQQQRPSVGRSARCQRASSEIPVRLPLISVEFVLWRRLLAMLEMSKRAFCKANASNGGAASDIRLALAKSKPVGGAEGGGGCNTVSRVAAEQLSSVLASLLTASTQTPPVPRSCLPPCPMS